MKRLFYLGLAAILVAACTSDEWFDVDDSNIEMSKTTRVMSGVEFLDIKEASIQNFTQEDWNALSKALSRLTIDIQKNGQYILKEKCGIEINISDRLYNIIKQGYANSNRIIAQTTKRISRVKSSANESNPTTNNPQTDCVGEAIANYYHLDLQSVNDSLSRVFPTYTQNGIHRDSLLYAVQLFNPNASLRNKFVDIDPMYTTTFNGIATIPGHALNTIEITRTRDHFSVSLFDYRRGDLYLLEIQSNTVPARLYNTNEIFIYQLVK